TSTPVPAEEAIKLANAIDWLNGELKLSAYARESFVEERRKIEDELKVTNGILKRIQDDLEPLDEEIKKLKTSKSIDEQAIKAKLKMELAIQEQLAKPESELSGLEKQLKAQIKQLNDLIANYEIEEKLQTLRN